MERDYSLNVALRVSIKVHTRDIKVNTHDVAHHIRYADICRTRDGKAHNLSVGRPIGTCLVRDQIVYPDAKDTSQLPRQQSRSPG